MGEFRLSWSVIDGRDCLRVDGLAPEELAAFSAGECRFAVLPAEAAESVALLQQLQPISGEFILDGNSLEFRPRFPFREGSGYVFLHGDGGGGWRAAGARRWTIWRPPASFGPPSARVLSIHPDVDEVPLNLLKFYVEFSARMSEGFAARAISIRRRDTGELLEAVFASMEPELWDPGRRRLTVLLDPGRIKRGLVPNAEAGYPLVEGVPIVVRIAEAMDSIGRPLAATFERAYDVGPAVRERVVPTRWQLAFPAPGARQPLGVTFDRALDHAIVPRAISVFGPTGSMAGAGDATPGDRGWRFVPREPWTRGEYQLVVDPALEDLAGNSVARIFDRDITTDDVAGPDAAIVSWHLE